MNVILVNPPNHFTRGKPKHKLCDYGITPPLGILYLSSVLEKNGISTKVIDAMAPLALLTEMDEMIQIIGRENPSVVGISATTPQIRGATQLATRLKEEFGKDLVIALGGIHVTSDPNFVKRFSVFDFGVIGEGEITFLKLVKRIQAQEKVSGIYYGESPTNLDEIPFPSRHLINKYHYFERGQEYANISASRGCPFNCVFCNVPASKGRRVRRRSVKNIVDEMEEIKDEYSGRFFFVDDSMTLNRKHTLQLCEEIMTRKMDFEWWCQTRVDLVDESLLKTMHRAGCISINFGVESGCERIRNMIIHKNITNEQIFRAFQSCKKIGIRTSCYLMLGFPTETRDELYQTANIAKKINPDIIGVHLTAIMPGTNIFERAVKDGIIANEIFDKYARGEVQLIRNWPTYIPKGLFLNDLLEARKKAYMKFYFRPQFILRRLAQDLVSWRNFKADAYTAWQLFRYAATPYSLDRMD